MNEFIKSKNFKIVVIVAGSFIIALIIFATGVSVGLFKARFSYRFGENYERNFVGQRQGGPMGMMGERIRDFQGKDFRNAHGVAGTIISIDGNNIIVKDRDGKENTVAITDKTIIKSGRNDIKITDLKNNEQIIVMGNPGDNGVVNADLIRVFDTNINTNNQQ